MKLPAANRAASSFDIANRVLVRTISEMAQGHKRVTSDENVEVAAVIDGNRRSKLGSYIKTD
jgi:hypothetical protein